MPAASSSWPALLSLLLHVGFSCWMLVWRGCECDTEGIGQKSGMSSPTVISIKSCGGLNVEKEFLHCLLSSLAVTLIGLLVCSLQCANMELPRSVAKWSGVRGFDHWRCLWSLKFPVSGCYRRFLRKRPIIQSVLSLLFLAGDHMFTCAYAYFAARLWV